MRHKRLGSAPLQASDLMDIQDCLSTLGKFYSYFRTARGPGGNVFILSRLPYVIHGNGIGS